jgi:DMSO/TMAO reductase YedYZ heme-binding membrane subunit
VKKDIREPLIYAVILTVLLGLRLWFRYRKGLRLRQAGAAVQRP